MAVDLDGPVWAVFCRSDLQYLDGCEPTTQEDADEVYRLFRINPYLIPAYPPLKLKPFQR